MTGKTFKDEFPSLEEYIIESDLSNTLFPKDGSMNWIRTDKIREYCLDKQKVRDVVEDFQNMMFVSGYMTKEDSARLTRKFDILKDRLGL